MLVTFGTITVTIQSVVKSLKTTDCPHTVGLKSWLVLGCKGKSVRLSKFKIIAKIFSTVFCDDIKVTVHVNSVDFISIGNSMICSDIWHKYHE